MVTVHVMPRAGGSPVSSAKPFLHLKWSEEDTCDTDLLGTSSTIVRSLKAYPYWPLSWQRNPHLNQYLHPSVVDYMQQKGLFMFDEGVLQRQARQLGALVAFHAAALVFSFRNTYPT